MSSDEKPTALKKVGHYEIAERVCQASWEDVYHARDRRSGKRVTVKMISPALPAEDQKRLFCNERDTL